MAFDLIIQFISWKLSKTCYLMLDLKLDVWYVDKVVQHYQKIIKPPILSQYRLRAGLLPRISDCKWKMFVLWLTR